MGSLSYFIFFLNKESNRVAKIPYFCLTKCDDYDFVS